jgi:hypothetical protein
LYYQSDNSLDFEIHNVIFKYHGLFGFVVYCVDKNIHTIYEVLNLVFSASPSRSIDHIPWGDRRACTPNVSHITFISTNWFTCSLFTEAMCSRKFIYLRYNFWRNMANYLCLNQRLKSMEQSPWEVNTSSAIQEILSVFVTRRFITVFTTAHQVRDHVQHFVTCCCYCELIAPRPTP